MGIVDSLISVFQDAKFTLQEAYDANPLVRKESVRARLYENLGTKFERLSRGVYMAKEGGCILLEGDGRDLSVIKDSSIDCIITDHPWSDQSANSGGNRNFATYDCFNYTPEDFEEKARVLKPGSFLVEILPAESESNFRYLYELKEMAIKAGFRYYCQVPWIKGTFVSNTGRNSKNSEALMVFSLGTPRKLRLDVKRTNALGEETFMSGTRGMLPTDFNVQAVPIKERICQSEKPHELFEQLLEYITLENEIVLDQFAGSGSVGVACLNKNRRCILIEKAKEQVKKIAERIGMEQCVSAGTPTWRRCMI